MIFILKTKKELEEEWINTNINNVLELINSRNYDLALSICQKFDEYNFLKRVCDYAYDITSPIGEVDFSIYSFFLFILNKNEKIEIHLLCILLWFFSLNHYIGATYFSLVHVNRILELDSQNYDAAEYLVLFYFHPDYENLIQKTDAIDAAKIMQKNKEIKEAKKYSRYRELLD